MSIEKDQNQEEVNLKKVDIMQNIQKDLEEAAHEEVLKEEVVHEEVVHEEVHNNIYFQNILFIDGRYTQSSGHLL